MQCNIIDVESSRRGIFQTFYIIHELTRCSNKISYCESGRAHPKSVKELRV